MNGGADAVDARGEGGEEFPGRNGYGEVSRYVMVWPNGRMLSICLGK